MRKGNLMGLRFNMDRLRRCKYRDLRTERQRIIDDLVHYHCNQVESNADTVCQMITDLTMGWTEEQLRGAMIACGHGMQVADFLPELVQIPGDVH